MRLEHLLRYLRALPTICVHPELDERTLDITLVFVFIVVAPYQQNLYIRCKLDTTLNTIYSIKIELMRLPALKIDTK